jgi:hypothetical protein
MLQVCVMDFKDNWIDHLMLTKLSYNNNYQENIGMAPSEVLYERKCRSLVCWDDIGEKIIIGPELEQTIIENVPLIHEQIKAAHDRQKKKKKLGLQQRVTAGVKVGEKLHLQISPTKKVMRFGKSGKLSPRFVGCYKILEWVGELTY